ncbi:hypothetical protein CN155_10245 [Sinorhizobium meliloti]|uniref:hypothetical protein n=1 Tax=Rhizobium meliloti TaxID=382 RepID=UPI000FD754D1|nr:hypothetical protein [Sinorhizobium meliloti]MDE3795827.1 hypothetical protein [Sinorhizobium meliloti]RVK58243.1 hypothetical protein CN155_10245 [Sinorhizobium meliloti]
MKIVLSKYQRYAALAAAVAIVVVQLYQFSEEGFEGYGWILSFLVAAVLAIVGIGPLHGTFTAAPKAPAPAMPKNPPLAQAEIDENHKRLRENAEVLAIEVEERAKVIGSALISAHAEGGLRLVNSDGSASVVEKGLDSFARDRALLFSLGLVGIRQAKGYSLYVTGIEYKETERKVFDTLVREAISGVMAMGLPVDRDNVVPQILGDLQAIRKCVVQSAEADKRGDAEITKPLIEWLERQGLKLRDERIVQTALQRGNT